MLFLRLHSFVFVDAYRQSKFEGPHVNKSLEVSINGRTAFPLTLFGRQRNDELHPPPLLP